MATNNSVDVPLSGSTGTGNFVGANTPTLITPVLGAATATSVNFGGSSLNTYVASTSWTPGFTFGTAGNLSVVYTTQTGKYIRIGDVVYYMFVIAATPTFSTASGLAVITGLPLTVNNAVQSSGTITTTGAVTYVGQLVLQPSGGSTSMLIFSGASASNGTFLTTTAFTTTVAFAISGTGFYFV